MSISMSIEEFRRRMKPIVEKTGISEELFMLLVIATILKDRGVADAAQAARIFSEAGEILCP
jgi:hypothetical protein